MRLSSRTSQEQHQLARGFMRETGATVLLHPSQREIDARRNACGCVKLPVLHPKRLVPNPDVLAALGERKGSTFLVGFAAETEDHEARGRAKLHRKHLDAIAVNDVRDERGFGTGENSLVLLWGDTGRRELGAARKEELAARLLDAVEELMRCS